MASILTYPQYWAFRLSGVRCQRGDVARLPHRPVEFSRARFLEPGRPPGLAQTDGAGAARPIESLGPILPEIAASPRAWRPDTPVLCGIHDSNASLLPHLIGRATPFSVVSTGTWVISMAIGGVDVELDPARDTLVNVNAFGEPVPSARFMGGREFETLLGDKPAQAVRTPMSRRCWPGRSFSRLRSSKARVRFAGRQASVGRR